VADYNGAVSFDYVVSDGQGGSDTGTVHGSVSAAYDARTVCVPSGYYAKPLVALNLKGTGLSISDIDAAGSTVTATLQVDHGTLHASAGDSGALVSGSGSTLVTVTGTVAQINALLASGGTSTLSYTDASGTFNTTLSLGVNDGGFSGTGGALSASAITVIGPNTANDAPSFTPLAAPSVLVDGAINTAIGTDSEVGYSVLVQPDGKIVVGGHSINGSANDFALLRYNANGSLDTSFSADGWLVTDFGGSDDYVSGMALKDGQIVLAGYIIDPTSGTTDFALARYNADGSLDEGFGIAGLVRTDLGSAFDYEMAYSVTVQADGRILLAGDRWNDDGDNDFALVRYNANGTPDTTFGTNGLVSTDFGPSWYDTATSVSVHSNGSIVLAGYSSDAISGATNFSLARYTAAGVLDGSFGTGGKISTDFAADTDIAASVKVLTDGSIVVAGSSFNGTDNDFALARYTVNGILDTGFGVGGLLTTSIGGSDSVTSMTVLPDGGILLAGSTDVNGSSDFVLVRYDASGTLDNSFSDDGILVTDLGSSSFDVAYSVTVQADGKILVAGSSDAGGTTDIALVRYNANGTLDSSFGEALPTLGGTVAFIEGGTPVVLDADVTVRDAQLDALNGGLGNYAGASLTIARSGGANGQDLFSATGTLGALTEGASLSVGGTVIGTVTSNSSGTLVLGFNASATTALVNGALRQIAYGNGSDAPPASVQLDWNFVDGNIGGQGLGGALGASGSVTVNITAIDDAPASASSMAARSWDIGLRLVAPRTDGDGQVEPVASAWSGAAGSDTLTGGSGSDLFVFSQDICLGDSPDTVTDFEAGSGGDVLDLSALLGAGATLQDGNPATPGLDAVLPGQVQAGSHVLLTSAVVDSAGALDLTAVAELIGAYASQFTPGSEQALLLADTTNLNTGYLYMGQDGNANGTLETGELHQVAVLQFANGKTLSDLVAENFMLQPLL
jgi:uncharacterized delta-60 repeat protein